MEHMCGIVLVCLLLMHVTPHYADHRRTIHKLIERINQNEASDEDNIIELTNQPEDLPRAEPIVPGHTLIKPAFGMLKSSIKYPQSETESLVYGNLDNLGITYGKTNERVLHTGFRKTAYNLLKKVLRKLSKQIYDGKKTDENIENSEERKKEKYKDNKNKKDKKDKEAHVFISPTHLRKKTENVKTEDLKDKNDAGEILEDTEGVEFPVGRRSDFRRRKSKKYDWSFDSRDISSDDSSLSDFSSASDYERNPGNPYTVYKDKYRQNWMWNHFMDGDHMNINPYAPEFNSVGPSAAALFFNRKWWYYNQDDYRPFQ